LNVLETLQITVHTAFLAARTLFSACVWVC